MKPSEHVHHFQTGVARYQAGAYEAALAAFEQARLANPDDAQSLYACATTLALLGQLEASYGLLASARARIWDDPDGACNLAVAAEAVGHEDEADEAYRRTLELAPNHVRALNNVAARMAARGRWDEALSRAHRCLELAPEEPLFWSNAIDFLQGDRQEEEALRLAVEACRRFGRTPEFAIRWFAALAFLGRLEEADELMKTLGPTGRAYLDEFLAQGSRKLPPFLAKIPLRAPDAQDLYLSHFTDLLQEADWRLNGTLEARLMPLLRRAQANDELRDWRDAQFFACHIQLTEGDQLAVRQEAVRSMARMAAASPLGRPRGQFLEAKRRRPPHPGDRIRVGIYLQSLKDTAYAQGLYEQMSLHNHQRFEFFLYSPDPAGPGAQRPLVELGAHVVEIGHMNHEEALGRTRLDRLDLWMDGAAGTQWCIAELMAMRVAPVQFRFQTWQRGNPDGGQEYTLGDRFTHGDGPLEDVQRQFGNIVRLPLTCWLPFQGLPTRTYSQAEREDRRSQLGLSTDSIVFAAHAHAYYVDPESLSAWVSILKAVPGSQLLLAAQGNRARRNLERALLAAGLGADRIFYMPRSSGAELQALLACADLMLDPLRWNGCSSLVTALHGGLPALNVVGANMSTRLGGSLLSAAGLDDCVLNSPSDYVKRAIELGNHPQALADLRSRLQALQGTAPLFDHAARLREWEWAWEHMVERDRAGLEPAAFDVPAAA